MAQQLGSVTQTAAALAPIKTQRLAAFVQAAVAGALPNINGAATQTLGTVRQYCDVSIVVKKQKTTRQSRGAYGQRRYRNR